jgi:hypothetical protein
MGAPVIENDSPTEIIIDRDKWVRMRTLFGESVMPPDDAEVTARAVNRAVALGDCTSRSRWRMVALWAADYLASEKASIAELAGDGEPNHEITVAPYSAVCSCGDWEYQGRGVLGWVYLHLAESTLGRGAITGHYANEEE